MFALLWVTACSAEAPGFVFEPGDCATPSPNAAMRCGVVRVPEDYGKPDGRQIALSVVVLPASEGSQKRVAEFDLEGGPGFAAMSGLNFYLTEGAAFRRTRDIVLADQRGAGGSSALRCPAIEAYDLQRPLQPTYPETLVKECATALGASADVTQYTTVASARDIDAIRRALGYETFSLYAVSYGTTLALRYVADFGAHVHSAVLVGAVPADRTPPLHHALNAVQGLELLIADCAVEAACAKAFPNLRADVDAAVALLNARGDLAREMFFEKIRSLMYAPASLRHVPFLLHRAGAGDFAPFDALTKPGSDSRVFSDGLYLSITCNETFAMIDVAPAMAEAAKTPFGDYRLARQKAACAHWPRGKADPGLMRKVTSDVPVLFISGAFDPVSPPAWARETLPLFPRGRQIIIARGAHVMDGLEAADTCIDAQVLRFMDTGKAEAVDAACFDQMRAQGYRTE